MWKSSGHRNAERPAVRCIAWLDVSGTTESICEPPREAEKNKPSGQDDPDKVMHRMVDSRLPQLTDWIVHHHRVQPAGQQECNAPASADDEQQRADGSRNNPEDAWHNI
jgi:hypothetical protein